MIILLITLCFTILADAKEPITYHQLPFAQIIIKSKADTAKSPANHIYKQVEPFSNQPIEVTGYTAVFEGKTYLVIQPAVKTCCVNMFPKEYERIYLNNVNNLKPSTAYKIRGILNIDFTNKLNLQIYPIESIEQIHNFTPLKSFKTITMGIILLFLAYRVRHKLKNSKMYS